MHKGDKAKKAQNGTESECIEKKEQISLDAEEMISPGNDQDNLLEIIEKMKQSRATTEEIKPITEFVEFKEADQSILFGEKLPAGLKRLN